MKYNPTNEQLKKQYEDVLLHGAHKEQKTVMASWKAINLFEKFTGKKDFITFNKEQAKSFKLWLTKQTNAKNEPLSLSTIRSTLANVRGFFKWLYIHPKYVRKIDGGAVEYLHLSKNDDRAGRATRELPVPTIEEINKALQAMPHQTDIEKRNRAIMTFVALTGVRDSALISLKMKDIDLEKKEIWQNPRHVRTKNRKGIETTFMSFDPLWEKIVIDWVTYAKEQLKLKDNDPIFPKTLVTNNPKTMILETVGLSNKHWANASPVRDIFKTSFKRVGLRYYNPHSFRKMLVTWAMENCSQYQVKAISQNLGHEHCMTTYNAYGTLNINDQRKAITGIGSGGDNLQNVSTEDLMAEIAKRTHQ